MFETLPLQEEALEKGRLLMSQGMARLRRASRQTRSHHMLILVLFAFVMLILFYIFKRIVAFFKWLL